MEGNWSEREEGERDSNGKDYQVGPERKDWDLETPTTSHWKGNGKVEGGAHGIKSTREGDG